MSRSHKQMQLLARNPVLYLRFQATGKLPEVHEPSSPLITLLEAIAPRDREAIVGVRISRKLGYEGAIDFPNAEALLRWLKPEPWVHGSTPADSRKLVYFRNQLHIEDLLEHARRYPEGVAKRYPRLCRPAPRPQVPQQT